MLFIVWVYAHSEWFMEPLISLQLAWKNMPMMANMARRPLANLVPSD
jgi:hypothetical protein